jgi:Xaa-Pro aminopeptidase
MKRGLVVLDPAEVPESEWRARVGALQQTLTAGGMDIALVYGDVYASDDIAYLTNLCIYWNEGLLAVPAAADPVFLTKLSPRVQPWMKRISTVSRIESGKSFGALAAKLLGELPAGTVGLVDAALWPASVVEEVRAALPGWQVRELGGLVRERRVVASEHELALLRQGAEVVAAAADEAVRGELPTFERVSVVERLVRGAGFLDVQVNTAATSDGVECVQVTGQFRTGWLHASRLTSAPGGAAGWTAVLREALEAAVAAATAGADSDALSAAALPALSRLPEGADAAVSWVNQADLSSGGEYRSRAEHLKEGSVVAVTVDLLFADGGYAALADTVLITSGPPVTLTTPATTTAATAPAGSTEGRSSK